MPYQIQVGSQVVEFPDSVGQDEAQRVLAEQFPATGEDISLALQDPTFKPSAADYAKYEEYAKTRQTDWLNTIAQSVDVAAGMIGGAISQGVQGAAANPLNYIEGAAQGTRQLYGLVAQSQDPASPLFKFKDLVAGTGTQESRYQQFLEARDFANTTARLERGEEGLFVPPELTNPEFVQGVSMILDPTLALPGIGEAFGAGKLATRAVGRGAQLAGRAVTGAVAPVERLVTGAERIAGEALSVSPEALRTTAATTGIAGALGIAPEAAALAAVPAAVRTTREVGEAITRAGENLLTQPSRIGPLEAIGAAPGANMRQRMLGVIGQYGGDAALDSSLRGLAGGIEGAAVGTVLGGLSGGEEGAAAGLGTGMVQGAAGALAARGIERLTGKAAREARAGDLGRFIDSQQDPTTKALFERVRDTHGVDAASALMDVEALTKGRFGDVDVLYRSNKDFSDQFGGSARGVQVVQAERPTIVINADIIGRGQGDTPLYTLGHELFHALEKSEQLSAGATEIKDALVGRWIQEGDVTRKLAEGALTDADIEARFNQYRDKLAAGNAEAAADLARYDTINKKADYIASEIAAEHFARLIAGQQPDAMLKGFSGLTRQLMDAALTQNVSKAIANAAASIERTFGVKPTDSVLFPDLKQASPQLNAMLRDLVRARRKLDERILAEDASPARTLKPQDVANPVAATQLVELGLAERMPDGSVRSLSDEEIRVREEKDTTTLKTILESLPGARVVDGEIQGRFSPQQLSAIEQSQAVSSRMKDKIRAVASAMDNGNSIFVNYGAATRRVKNRLTGKLSSKYSSGIRLSQREVLPYSFYLSKADNPVVKVIDLTKIRGGLERLTAPDGSIAGGLWDNVDGFMGDLAKYFTNLDAKENARRSSELFGADKARFLGDFVNEQEKGGRKFVRDLRLDRIGSTASMPFRARISEDAIQLSKLRWMPAETVGDKSVINSEEGYRIISGAKHKLYGPDGKLLGIFDTQTQAERKADATQARLQPEVDQQQRPARDEGRQAAEAGRGDRALGRTQGREEGRQELGAVRQEGDVGARFMAASEADPSQPSTQAIRSVKGQRAVNSLYQFDYTYKTKTPGKPAREKAATETISAFSISEAKEKAKAAIMKELTDDPTVLRSTISISQPEIKGQFAVTELTGKPADPKSPKIVLNPGTPQKFTSMFNAVDAALDLVKDSPALGLDSDGWIKAYSRALNGSRASVPPAPLRLAQWVQDNGAFRKFIEDGLQRNPELVKSAVGGLNALQPIHELARQGQIPSKMVALHMFWGLLSRMLDPYNQEAGWARLTSEPKVLRLIEDSVEGRYKFTKDQWKEIVSTKMSEFPDVSVGRNAIQNANAFHEMLSRWNGRWDELTSIINNPDLTGPQMRRQFNEKGFGGAGIKHKVLSFVLATLARNDVFVGDRWQVVNLWFPHLEKAAAARKAQGGSTEVFAYDRNGVPEDTTGAYKVIGGMLNNETVAETAYSLIENGMRKIAAESPWLREMLGREPQPFDIHWLTWNIIKNEPVGHSSLDATAKFLTENLYGDPEFAQKFAETEKRTEKYAKGVFDVFSVKGQERPQIRQRPGADDGGAGAAGIGPDAGRSPGGPAGPGAGAAGASEVGSQRYMPDQQGFYSKLEEVVNAKLPKVASPQQVLSSVDPAKGSGVKPEELKWTGFAQAVERIAKENGGKVPKEKLIEHLKNEGRVRFEEVDLSEKTIWTVGDRGYSEKYTDLQSALRAKQEVEDFLSGEIERRWDVVEQDGDFVIVDEYGDPVRVQKSDSGREVWEPESSYKSESEAYADLKNGAKEVARSHVYWNESQEGADFYSDYQLPGGRNYREVVLTSETAAPYTSSHFRDIPFYVAHMRVNERTAEAGKPGLFIEEIQSDRHQQAREQGYREDKGTDWSKVPVYQYKDLVAGGVFPEVRHIEVRDGIYRLVEPDGGVAFVESSLEKLKKNYDLSRRIEGVSDAPFRKDWSLQMFKRALRDAVASGKEWIGWTTGETQANRYDLSKQIKTLSVEPLKDETGKFAIYANGNLMRHASRDTLSDVVGKEMAQKALSDIDAGKAASYSGLDLKIGGEGMKGFYDKILPAEVQKYVKQWGGEVRKSNFSIKEAPIWRVDITPEMRKSVETVGQPRFMPSDTDYLSAVQQGDTQAAQRMVDEAAKAAGYTVGPVYHGTPTGGFNVFDKRMRGETSGVSRQAFSFTTNQKAAENYSKRLGDEAVRLDAGLRVANDAMRRFDDDVAAQEYFSSKGYTSVEDGMLPEFDWGAIEDVPEFIKELRGYAKDLKPINPDLASSFIDAAKVMSSTKAVPEVKRVFLRIPENAPVFQATPSTLGMVMRDFSAEREPTKAGIVELPGNERIYYVADSSQVKLADPVTKDAQGNVIPLSKRFQASSEDIRYMPQPDSAMPGAYSFPGGYRALPGKAKGSLRLYGPAGSLIGIAASLDEAQRIIRRKTRQ